MSEPRTSNIASREQMVDALRRAFAQFEGVVAGVPPSTAPIRNSAWTVGELLVHVTAGLEAYARYLHGESAALFDVSDIAGGSLAASNAANLTTESERSVSALRKRAVDAFGNAIARVQALDFDEEVPWHGRREPLRRVLAALLGELLMHGSDLAVSVGSAWPIRKDDAVLLLDNIAPLLPLLLDETATRDLVADVRVKIRGGNPIILSFDHGSLRVGGKPHRFDATVSADPVSFLLVAYGRRSQWSEIARGGLLAWGRRPSLALKLTSYLVPP